MTRYFFVVLLMGLVGIAIVVKGAMIMFAERQYWHDVADRFVKENVTVKPNRGNILSSDGKLMASSLPEYKIYMDFMSGERDEAAPKHQRGPPRISHSGNVLLQRPKIHRHRLRNPRTLHQLRKARGQRHLRPGHGRNDLAELGRMGRRKVKPRPAAGHGSRIAHGAVRIG